eukprot:TRINITY_DN3569_c0_g1_i1.p1 TRINITY_DN3569_c0_g1~~TRINITY_DN3569_c0_g1_i1.p1  ORF type:complete len:181 (+),score=29.80 TRINITY_DN3569_c0_g1_i1:36-545(+)
MSLGPFATFSRTADVVISQRKRSAGLTTSTASEEAGGNCSGWSVGLVFAALLLLVLLKHGDEAFELNEELFKDNYKVLGLAASADLSLADIRKAYRKLAVKLHPDKNPNCVSCTKQFQELTAAHELLQQWHSEFWELQRQRLAANADRSLKSPRTNPNVPKKTQKTRQH